MAVSLFARNSKVMFGRVCVRGTRVTVAFIKGRFSGGDSIHQIARSYNLPESTVRAAVNYNRRSDSTKLARVGCGLEGVSGEKEK